ncbi:hypothetical protein K402DRAFT_38833 [Aulographum hederae CBS 113979]|uniref:Uncharacterized protein n=1 Tax=Aulographum hederae CBS 113979 TaxID=1176131 RepID=A0A6G1H447_9PEZI|nr:hypothetical protein K402DRAFT_38833 [Aulographum hederae CBS 113979]
MCSIVGLMRPERRNMKAQGRKRLQWQTVVECCRPRGAWNSGGKSRWLAKESAARSPLTPPLLFYYIVPLHLPPSTRPPPRFTPLLHPLVLVTELAELLCLVFQPNVLESCTTAASPHYTSISLPSNPPPPLGLAWIFNFILRLNKEILPVVASLLHSFSCPDFEAQFQSLSVPFNQLLPILLIVFCRSVWGDSCQAPRILRGRVGSAITQWKK